MFTTGMHSIDILFYPYIRTFHQTGSMKNTTLAIFIATGSTADTLSQTLTSLEALPPTLTCDVTVLTAEETAEDVEACLAQYMEQRATTAPCPATACLAIEPPYSTPKAFNTAAAKSTASYVLFLTAGARLTTTSVMPLIDHLEQNSTAGIAAPLLVCPESGRVQSCGTTFTPSLKAQPFLASFPANHPAVLTVRSMQAVPLQGLLMRRELFITAKMLDTGYRTGMEILDLCCAVRDMNKTVDVVPDAVLLQPDAAEKYTDDDLSIDTMRLNQRCEGCLGPDKHTLAKALGYQIALSPWLESYITLTPAREQELNERMMQSPDPATVYTMLQEEPLWQTGYVQLAAYLEATGSFAEACGIRLLQTFFFPMLPLYRKLAAVAEAAGNDALKTMATEKLEHIDTQLEEVGPLTKKAAGLANWARKAGEKELQALYEGWLSDLGLL